jgi:ketosteroid isomerase-like protein
LLPSRRSAEEELEKNILVTGARGKLGGAVVEHGRLHQALRAQVHNHDGAKEIDMTDNEKVIRNAYQRAEMKDVPAWVACFTEDGIFIDESIGVTYRGPKELGRTVEIYAKAFPDMHRELYDVYVAGDIVVVELALQGTHKGPLELPMGIIPATGKRMDAPCCDVFRLKNGKIQRFDCYPSGTITLAQLGVLPNLQAVLSH